MNTKVYPIRTCVACRQSDGKRSLLRFVRTDQGILHDCSGRLNGRGAYLCSSASCLNEAVKKQILQRVLKAEMPAPTLLKIKELACEIGGENDG